VRLVGLIIRTEFVCLFSVPISHVTVNVQMEVIYLQFCIGLRRKWNKGRVFDIYSKYSDRNTFWALYAHVLKMVSLSLELPSYPSSFFSRMMNVKSETSTQITNTHLKNSLRIATCQIKAGVDRIAKNKHCQIYH